MCVKGCFRAFRSTRGRSWRVGTEDALEAFLVAAITRKAQMCSLAPNSRLGSVRESPFRFVCRDDTWHLPVIWMIRQKNQSHNL
jgi:hypothetical protein